MKGKRVLITGGMGFIGSNLALKCLQMGAQVTIYDCLDPKSGGNKHNVSEILDDIDVVDADIRDAEVMAKYIKTNDIIFSCAAYTSHPNSMKEPLIDIDVNCKGVIYILEAARKYNPEIKIVHVGTSTQIGQMKFDVADELHPEFPLDIYSANKSVSEKYVLIYGRSYNLDTCVVRLTNVFGPRSNIRSSDFGFMNYFIGLGLQNKEISVFGKGEQLRTFIYVEDAVDALIQATLNPVSKHEVYFAGLEEPRPVSSIAEKINEIIGGTLEYVAWPKDREVIEIGDAIISCAKIRNDLGWKPKNSLESGLELTREYFVDKLDKYLY